MPPEELKQRKRWLLWRYVIDRKVPHTIAGRYASSTNPDTWSSYEDAVAAFADEPGKYEGLGFVLGDGICGIDLDDCRNPDTGAIAPWAQEIIDAQNSYAEISPSGTGVKIFCLGDVPQAYKRPTIDGGSMEVYASGRFFCFTGRAI